ncbi:MAG: hypothetical protein GXO90_06010, partial [FCB group bacterium]|nr:hypothetical protein [FCB group bacterium]
MRAQIQFKSQPGLRIFSMLVALVSIVILVQCNNKTDLPRDVILSGTSFGECVGYCQRELEITATSIEYTATGWDEEQYPPRIKHEELSSSEWDRYRQGVDLAALQSYPDVIGCPDCTDGGAEWIEVDLNGEHKKITFEYGDSLA